VQSSFSMAGPLWGVKGNRNLDLAGEGVPVSPLPLPRRVGVG
jgi:hypothetical protein